MKNWRVFGLFGLSLIAFNSLSGHAQSPARDAQRAPLVDGILSAFKTSDVVCLGEHNHASVLDSDLRIAVVKHPDFPKLANTVVVEFAQQAHQDVLDRFILEGADLSRKELSVVWRDSASAELWDAPIYEAFFRAIRDVNLKLPKDKRVRVIAGDRAPDWAKVRTAEDLLPFLTPEFTNRGKFIRTNIATEVLDKHLKALAVYGAGHCTKLGIGFPGELGPSYPGRIWAVYSFMHGPGEQKGLAAFNLVGKAAYVPIADTPYADMVARDFFVAVRMPDTKVRSVVDAVITFGAAPDEMSVTDAGAFQAEMGAEMERRKRLMAEAKKVHPSAKP
jgi:hypothetical protein